MYQLYRDFNLVKKGQKIRAWVNPPPFRALPERKRAFPYDVFPYIIYRFQPMTQI